VPVQQVLEEIAGPVQQVEIVEGMAVPVQQVW
jgi:hypothetical protein